MLTAQDFTGLMALPPTPLLADVDPLGPASTVDIDEAVRLARQLVDDGARSIGLCGTTGEGATLTWDEKAELFAAVRQAVDVPVLGGTTALGTKEVVRQMREVRALGLDGAFVGLPLWQTPTVHNAVGFHADLSAAVPDLAVLVYANAFFFKFNYPLEFWEGIADRCPTVVACKVGFGLTPEILAATKGRVNFLHGEGGTLTNAYKTFPAAVTGGWATSAAMGPEPWVAAFAAIADGDRDRALAVLAEIDAVPLPVPDWAAFAQYNLQLEKARIDSAGYTRCGPPRPPYVDLPPDWEAAAQTNAKAWQELRARYVSST